MFFVYYGNDNVLQIKNLSTYFAIPASVLDRVQLAAIVPQQNVVQLAGDPVGERVRLQQIGEGSHALGATSQHGGQRLVVDGAQCRAFAAVPQPERAQPTGQFDRLQRTQLHGTRFVGVAEIVKALLLLLLVWSVFRRPRFPVLLATVGATVSPRLVRRVAVTHRVAYIIIVIVVRILAADRLLVVVAQRLARGRTLRRAGPFVHDRHWQCAGCAFTLEGRN